MSYPITEEHKRAAVESLKRLAPDLEVKLYNSVGWGWQILVSNTKTKKEQSFDAYLVSENFLKRPEFADQSMLDELCEWGLLTRVVESVKVSYL